jgi:hypothetical protein
MDGSPLEELREAPGIFGTKRPKKRNLSQQYFRARHLFPPSFLKPETGPAEHPVRRDKK